MRIGLLSYRSKTHCGGQGVYVRYLSRGLVELGHEVEVFSGQPYPEDLDPRVRLTKVPSLDLFGGPDFPRRVRLRDFGDRYDVLEYLTTKTGTFAEPLAFSYRMANLMRTRAADFDVLHDNQCLGYGLLTMRRRGIPLAATIHHAISRDRRVELDAARLHKKWGVLRWYGFVRMQARVARRLPVLIGVSDVASADAIADFRIDPAAFRVVPLGVDTDVFRPADEQGPGRVPGRIVAVASADRPLKGVAHLLDAMAKLRVDHDVELQLVSTLEPGGATERRIAELGLRDAVTVRTGLTDAELAALLASAEVMCVPSLYEGFSLPTVEALACGTPVVASRAGALPEVVGDAGVLVEPGDAGSLVTAIDALLRSPAERARLSAAGRARAEERFSWTSVARATVAAYEDAIAAARAPEPALLATAGQEA
ncbi:glycosyltransferase family 4 protein [Cryptosporangium aurantiacum]|uniref:Glycosyltransferase involved in cell wall bisynthesis n=1 Tax=Cryptosporangium aurantiacum TaxID=134849 RepID=A0A1M7RKE5_9ACTN|nr:glycosyltransferase family 4 protein [Cryptosporangium aurantiacum]SHN46538.1 Glycosyltransferase involved in cell wall bisynthesis [Cryptosporangium aurantiacum]